MTLKYEKTKTHDEWLELRRRGIGGSDAATLVGLNEYSSPYLLWLDKLGKTEPDEPGEAAKLGTELEDYVARKFTEKTGKKVQKVNRTIFNETYPFAHANVDRKVLGENAYLECKTINPLRWNHYEDGEFPTYYYIQCLHYMMVTGAEKMYLAVLPLQKGLEIFEIERDEEAIANLAQLEKEFWEENVKKEIPPEVDGTRATDEALKLFFDHPDDSKEVVHFFNMDSRVEEMNRLIEQKKELEKEIDKIKQEFKQELGNATTGETESHRITWKPQTTRRFKYKDFMKDHPEFDYDPYYKESKTRVFKIKNI